MVGLKTTLYPQNKDYWLSCGHIRCFLRQCFGWKDPNKILGTCTLSIFMIEKLGGESGFISPGDRVVLRPIDNIAAMIVCGGKGVCKPRTTCYDIERDCPQHILNVQSPSVASIHHTDNITLSFDDGSWLGCDPYNTARCKRRKCDSDTPNTCYEEFEVFIL